MESDGYEVTNILRAYRSKRRAKKFIKAINDYLETVTYPKYPLNGSFDDFISEVDKINSKHPAKMQTEGSLYIEQVKVY